MMQLINIIIDIVLNILDMAIDIVLNILDIIYIAIGFDTYTKT